MPKPILVLGLICVCATAALAQGKTATGWECEKPGMAHSLAVGDQPNHAYVLAQIKCTATKGVIEGVKEQEGTAAEFLDVTGNNAKGHGIFVETLANGDKINFTYQPTYTLKDGLLQSGSNKWQATGRTGKFRGIKGSGSCTAAANADGSTSFTCSGAYSLPK